MNYNFIENNPVESFEKDFTRNLQPIVKQLNNVCLGLQEIGSAL